MGILPIILLIARIIFKLPSYIKVLKQILDLIRQMKDQPFIGDLKILGEILKLILGMIAVNKSVAGESLDALKSVLENKEDLKEFKKQIEEKKQKCEGNFCPSDTK